MSTTAVLVQRLVDALAASYPARFADLTARPGAVSCAVAWTRTDYDWQAMCEPTPVTVTCDIVVLAAQAGPQGAADVLAHLEPVRALAAGAGFACERAEPSDANDHPALIITATAPGEG